MNEAIQLLQEILDNGGNGEWATVHDALTEATRIRIVAAMDAGRARIARETTDVRARNTPDDDEKIAMIVLKSLEDKKWLRPSSTTDDDRAESVIGIVERAIAIVRARNTPGADPRANKRAKVFAEEVPTPAFLREDQDDRPIGSRTPGVSIKTEAEDHSAAPDALFSEGQAIVKECRELATLFVLDNSFLSGRTDAQQLIENAVLIGASVALRHNSAALLGSLRDVNKERLEGHPLFSYDSVRAQAEAERREGEIVESVKADSGTADQGTIIDEHGVKWEKKSATELAVKVYSDPKPITVLREIRDAHAAVWRQSPEGRAYLEKCDQALDTLIQPRGSKPVDFVGIGAGSKVMSPFGGEPEQIVEIVHVSSHGVTFNHPVRGGSYLGFNEMSSYARAQLITPWNWRVNSATECKG
jgi:hypothetical protein